MALFVDGAMLTSWFADSAGLRPGGPFHAAFGDGDFFSGMVTEWDPPISLGLEWRFLGVGPSFDIRFSLLPVGDQTELTVTDRGAASVEEASGLREGWEDFLMRCEKLVRTGENSRYRWTETFGGTAYVTQGSAVLPRLADRKLWRAFFPGANTSVHTDAAIFTSRRRSEDRVLRAGACPASARVRTYRLVRE